MPRDMMTQDLMDALCARLAYLRRGRYQVCAILITRTSSGGMVPRAQAEAIAGAIRLALISSASRPRSAAQLAAAALKAVDKAF